MRKKPIKSKVFYVTTRTVVVKRYEVLAPTAKQALMPIDNLIAYWPCRLMGASTTIDNVADKRVVDRKFNSQVIAAAVKHLRGKKHK